MQSSYKSLAAHARVAQYSTWQSTSICMFHRPVSATPRMLCSVWRLAVWRCTQMRSFFHGRLCKSQEMTLLLVLLVSQQPQSTPAGLFDRCILLLSWARQTLGLHSVWIQASAGFSLQVEGWAYWRPSSSWQVESSWSGVFLRWRGERSTSKCL